MGGYEGRMNKPMTKEELSQLTNRKPRIARWHVMAGVSLFHGYRKGVELGVSAGRFTMFLCGTIHDMEMIAVDRWESQPNNTVEGGQTYMDWDHEASYRSFSDNCERFFPGRVKILRMDTSAAAPVVEDESQDFVFIDADHSYEGCKRDIENWLPKVRRGGMLCGHDYSTDWPMVQKAVDERGWKFAVGPDHVWMYIKP